MTGTTEERPRDRRGRDVRANPAAAINWAGSELNMRAWQVAARVFEHMGITDPKYQEARFDELFAEMEIAGFPPNETTESIVLTQGQVAIGRQRKRHADVALRQTVRVEYLYRKLLSPTATSTTLPGAASDGDLKPALQSMQSPFQRMQSPFQSMQSPFQRMQSAFQRMQSALLEAQQHLTALDILKNLESSLYSLRAKKGGHAKPRPASEKDQETLLDVMIKNMLYNDPDAIKRVRRNAESVAYEWSQRIYLANREFEFLNITSVDQLQSVVYTLLLNHLKRLDTGKDASSSYIQARLIAQLRRPPDAFHNKDTAHIEAELTHKRYFREGVQSVLEYLMKGRFVELPCQALDTIREMDSVDDLQTCLDRLPEAASWQEVLQQRESPS